MQHSGIEGKKVIEVQVANINICLQYFKEPHIFIQGHPTLHYLLAHEGPQIKNSKQLYPPQ